MFTLLQGKGAARGRWRGRSLRPTLRDYWTTLGKFLPRFSRRKCKHFQARGKKR